MNKVRFKNLNLIAMAIVAIMLLLGVMFTTLDIAFAESSDFKSGDGTKENPYKITNSSELNNVRYHLDSYFLQTDNIDLQGNDFAPIGSIEFPFQGHYDGGKYSISNMKINSTQNNVGLFSYVRNGSITNLKIVKSTISGNYNVGAVVGSNQGEVIGCVSESEVFGNGAVGGIVGLNMTSVTECANKNTIKAVAGKYVGGVVGVNKGVIADCYNLSEVQADSYAGGITGMNDGANAKIEESFNVGTISARGKGQIAGDNMQTATISNCIWQQNELEVAAPFANGGITANKAISYASFANSSSFVSWAGFHDNWRYLTGIHYPILLREYVSVESVDFENPDIELKPGESYEFSAAINPVHATVRDIEYSLTGALSDIEYDKINKTIYIKENATIGNKITINAKAEGKTSNLIITIVKIPVKSVEIINESGIKEISAASSIKFNSVVYPQNASYNEVKYSVSSSFAQITEDGVLTIKENTPIGLEIFVTATAKDNNSIYASTKVVVTDIKVDKVEITNQNSFKVTEMLELTAQVSPHNATNKDVTYEIISSTASGAEIIGNILYATSVGQVTIRAKADGVYSNSFVIDVLKEPVTSIKADIPETMVSGESLPLMVTVTPHNATNKQVAYSLVTNTSNAKIIDNVLYAKIDGTITIEIKVDELTIYHTIIVSKIDVDSIMFNNKNEFKHTESLHLVAEVMPKNATYQNVEFSIISDNTNAHIKDNVLFAEQPGSLIVQALVDGVTEQQEIKVLKEEVKNVTIIATYIENQENESLQFRAEIYPKNATNQQVEYRVVSGPATITNDGVLVVNSNVAVGTEILVSAVADGVSSNVYRILTGNIAVKNVTLSANESAVKIGNGLQLNVLTNPEIVSNPGVTFETDGNCEIIDNVLYVYDVNMVGKQLSITAIVDGVRSNTISILVEKTDVQAVGFTCASLFKITESLQLTANVFPANATYPNVTFAIISSGDTGAYIEDNILYADKEGIIKIRATADGVTRDLVVHAMKESVTNVMLTSQKTIKVYEELLLTSIVYPTNATYKNVRYEIVNNEIGAMIFDNNILYCENVGIVTLRVYADEIYRDFEIEIIKEPVVNIVLNCATVFKHTETLQLSANVLPRNATYNNIVYEIIVGADFASIQNGVLHATRPGNVVLKLTADGFSKEFTIKVIKEAVTNIELDGTNEVELNKGFRLGEIELKSNVYPFNATYPNVEYNIVEFSSNCNAYIEGGYLQVKLNYIDWSNNYAKNTQATVRVSATADDITTYRIYKINKIAVSEITLSKQVETTPGNIKDTEDMTFKTSGSMYITVNILSELATCKDYIIKFNGDVVEVTEDNIYKLTNDFPETIKVTIESKCDANTIQEFEFIVQEELINEVYLGSKLPVSTDENIEKKIKREKRGDIPETANSLRADIGDLVDYKLLEVQQGSSISLRAFANAADYTLKATYGYKEYLDLYYEINGNSFKFVSGEDNEYFEYSGSELKIKSKAPVNKSFNLYAKAQHGGLESERTTIQIQSKYILDIISTTIDGNGLVNGLEGLYERDSNTSDIEKVRIKISRSSDTLLEKTIVTKDPSLRLQLCVPVKGGSYNLEYEVFFNENGNQYSYVLPKVTTFNGISSISDLESYYNSIVMLNFAGGASSSNYTIQKNVKALFVYGNNNTVNTLFNINNDDKNTFDMHLESINFSSGGNCININNTGNASLTINGNVSLTAKSGSDGTAGADYNRNEEVIKYTPRNGGNGTAGGNGSTGIYANCNLTIVSNGILSVNAGNGGNGGSGGDGEGSDTADIGQAGHGGNGGNGGQGGNGIYVSKGLVLQGNRIIVTSGAGGNGGYAGSGGNDSGSDAFSTADSGGNGGTGGSGGNSGHGIVANTISINCSTLNITTKNGGTGRNGGSGGNTRLVPLDNRSLRGAGGTGGNGGNSGSGIVTHSSISHSCTIGNAGSAGSRGSDGTSNNDVKVKVCPNSTHAGSSGSKGSNVTRGWYGR